MVICLSLECPAAGRCERMPGPGGYTYAKLAQRTLHLGTKSRHRMPKLLAWHCANLPFQASHLSRCACSLQTPPKRPLSHVLLASAAYSNSRVSRDYGIGAAPARYCRCRGVSTGARANPGSRRHRRQREPRPCSVQSSGSSRTVALRLPGPAGGTGARSGGRRSDGTYDLCRARGSPDCCVSRRFCAGCKRPMLPKFSDDRDEWNVAGTCAIDLQQAYRWLPGGQRSRSEPAACPPSSVVRRQLFQTRSCQDAFELLGGASIRLARERAVS